MLTYLDASLIASLLFNEPASDRVVALVLSLGVEVVVGDLASAEVSSAVSRRFRMGRVSLKTANSLLSALDEFRSKLPAAAALDAEDVQNAEQLVRSFELKLRAPDAIHAAVCLRHNYQLATLDTNLAYAARLLDVACINPADPIGEQKN